MAILSPVALFENMRLLARANASGDAHKVLETYYYIVESLAQYHAMPLWASTAAIAVQAAEALDDEVRLLELRQQRAMAASALGSAEALDELRDVARAAAVLGLPGTEARCEAVLGQRERDEHRYATAVVHLDRAAQAYKEARDPIGEARAISDKGGALRGLGDPSCMEMYAESVSIFKRQGDYYGAAVTLANAAAALEDLQASAAQGVHLIAAGAFHRAGRADRALYEELLAASSDFRTPEVPLQWIPRRLRRQASLLPEEESRRQVMRVAGSLLRGASISDARAEGREEPLASCDELLPWATHLVDELESRFGSTEASDALRLAISVECDQVDNMREGAWRALTGTVPLTHCAADLDALAHAELVHAEGPSGGAQLETLARNSNEPTKSALLALAHLWRLRQSEVLGETRNSLLALEDHLPSLPPWSQLSISSRLAMATAYREEAISSDRAEDLERAVALNGSVLEDAIALGDEWLETTTRLNFANSLLERLNGDRTQNLDEADRLIGSVLSSPIAQQNPLLLGLALHSQGLVHRARGDEEQAAEALEQAVLLIPSGHPQRARALTSFANASLNRLSGDIALNAEVAVQSLREALPTTPVGNRSSALGALAVALEWRRFGDRRRNLEEALACHMSAARLELEHGDLLEVGGMLNNIGTFLLRLAAGGLVQRGAALPLARRCLHRSLTLRRDHPSSAQSLHNLALVEAQAAEDEHDLPLSLLGLAFEGRQRAGDWYAAGESALELARIAWEAGDQALIDSLRPTLTDIQYVPLGTWTRVNAFWLLGVVDGRRESWGRAAELLEEAMSGFEGLYAQASLGSSQTDILTDAATLSAATAHALVALGRHEEAAVVLERSRARTLTEYVERSRLDMTYLRNVRPDLEARLRQIAAAEQPLVRLGGMEQVHYLSVATLGGRRADGLKDERPMSVVEGRRHQRLRSDFRQLVEEIRSLSGLEDFLRPLERPRLRQLLVDFGHPTMYVAASGLGTVLILLTPLENGTVAARSSLLSTPRAEEVLERTLQPLLILQVSEDASERNAAASTATRSVPEVVEAIVRLVPSPQSVNLVATGILGVLPWGALEGPIHRRPLLGRPVALLPSLRLAASGEAQDPAQELVIVANATGDLGGTEIEAGVVAHFFPGSIRIEGERATHEELLSRLGTTDALHFAPHALFDPSNPLQSGLLLSDGILTAADLLRSGKRVPGRLVLSACQTGVFDFARAPDEYTGLLTAFLARGVREVVATLWSVNDFATHGEAI